MNEIAQWAAIVVMFFGLAWLYVCIYFRPLTGAAASERRRASVSHAIPESPP